MKTQVLHTVRCNISGEAAGEFWNWSLSGVKGLNAILWLRSRLVILSSTRWCIFWSRVLQFKNFTNHIHLDAASNLPASSRLLHCHFTERVSRNQFSIIHRYDSVQLPAGDIFYSVVCASHFVQQQQPSFKRSFGLKVYMIYLSTLCQHRCRCHSNAAKFWISAPRNTNLS